MDVSGPRPAAHPTPRIATFDADGFSRAELVERKGGSLVTVCIPAKDEAATIEGVVAPIVVELTAPGGSVPLVDEVLVVDDGSTDHTAVRAAGAGATVLRGPAGGYGGKGQAMSAGLEAARGDVVVFVDGDVTTFGAHFVTGLLGPVLTRPDVMLVKGFYERPLDGLPDAGGRVTQLMARPLIDVLFPELADVRQPLAGETAGPRAVFEKCGLEDGYAVELALLVDVAQRFGTGAIAQVDLGVRAHRNRPLDELRGQATDILRAVLTRAGAIPPGR